MEQLELLWNLEIHHNSLEQYQKELFDLSNSLEIKELKIKRAVIKQELSKFELKQDSDNSQVGKLEKELANFVYENDEIEKSLYKGDIQDLKQLEYLSSEKDKLKEIINETETKILELFDDIEARDKKIISRKLSMEEIKETYNNTKNKHKKLLYNVNIMITEEEGKISAIEEKIEKSLLDRYIVLRKTRSSGIAEVIDGICSGCNMHIPTFQVSKLIDDKEIVYCESCGRIICKF